MSMILAWPAWAAEKLFDIVKTDGVVQPVTDDDFRSIGRASLKTILVSDKTAKHQVVGVRFRDVLAHFSVQGSIADVIASDAYEMEIPVEDLNKYDVVLATHVDGEKLRLRDRGPIWVVYPLSDHPELVNPIFEARSVWQVKEIKMK